MTTQVTRPASTEQGDTRVNTPLPFTNKAAKRLQGQPGEKATATSLWRSLEAAGATQSEVDRLEQGVNRSGANKQRPSPPGVTNSRSERLPGHHHVQWRPRRTAESQRQQHQARTPVHATAPTRHVRGVMHTSAQARSQPSNGRQGSAMVQVERHKTTCAQKQAATPVREGRGEAAAPKGKTPQHKWGQAH